MNKYLILINTQGGQIEIHPRHFIDYPWYVYFWTYRASTPWEAQAMAEDDFRVDYAETTLPLSFISYELS